SDGDVTGIVEPRRGRFREEDLLTLTSAPFHTDVRPGTRGVTTGRGGIYPRGIPLGWAVGIDEADTGWRWSYLLRAAGPPGGATRGCDPRDRGDPAGGPGRRPLAALAAG